MNKLDSRPVCMKCNQRMIIAKNGVEIEYCDDQNQRGDLAKCEKCLCEVLVNLGNPYPKRGNKK